MQPIMFSSKTWRQMKVCNNTLEVYVYWLQDWIFVQWYSFLIKMKHVDFFFFNKEKYLQLFYRCGYLIFQWVHRMFSIKAVILNTDYVQNELKKNTTNLQENVHPYAAHTNLKAA